MAFPFNDQVYTKSFTPREYQVELLYRAKQKNIIICLGKYAEQTFIVTKVIQECVTGNRGSVEDGAKRIIYLLDNEESCLLKSSYIEQLTDLKVIVANSSVANDEFTRNFSSAHILVTTYQVFHSFVKEKIISVENINLLIFDQCQLLTRNEEIIESLTNFKCSSSNENMRIIGLAIPLLDLTEEPGRLSLEIDRLEETFQCDVETTSDILSILRYSPKPKEYVIEYDIEEPRELHQELKNIALDAINFLNDHRYDPTEIYQDEFLEDIQKIPDPTEKPREMLEDFLDILETLGVWCADRAALSLLALSEKLKIKTPYERHYLLLNLVGSVMIKIRALCDNELQPINEKNRVYQYSTSKIHRLLEALKTYAPFYNKTNNNNDKINRRNYRNNDNNSFKSNQGQMNNLIKQPEEAFNNNNNNNSNNNNNKRGKYQKIQRGLTDPDLLCGVIFVDKSFTAKILFYLLNEICKYDEDLSFLSPLYTIEKNSDDSSYSRDPEAEHKKQEEVLKRFRIHECNLLVSTAILEEGIEIPKCNFVMRYDFPRTYKSYVQCKSRARAPDALHILLVPNNSAKDSIWQLAQYHYIEKVLLQKCTNDEPSEEEEIEADMYSGMMPYYQPVEAENAPMVTFNSAISLVNRYCAKLPSDTFTRLTPEWSIKEIEIEKTPMYTCSLRLPINSPLKYVIESHPMPNKAMARRLGALQLCIKLHKENEIDDNLLPIGKENFKARPEDIEVPALPDEIKSDYSEARPGTTKRRQYYYKKTAEALTDCRPTVGVPSYLYHIKMILSCPLPEEQNTRGRRIYPPEESDIGFGILTLKKIPKLCPFPIYTRSGEVQVELKLSKNTVVLDSIQLKRISTFLNYTFTNVLKLQKYLMIFDPNASENSYIIVPVIKTKIKNVEDINVDWNFLQLIYDNRSTIPSEISEDKRVNFQFDSTKYNDAVIMPWYRNQDQPQYFYVAEICKNLSPKSSFPGDGYTTFEEYYLKKYCIKIQNTDQPLLDVDHTSARLNFLTPRYVNRKGVALPTSSEETKRAKRENLEQKQILVAELCAIHPFPASLWRQAVCLPCILYRMNALLLANQIRCQVAEMMNLGKQHLSEDFEWPPLNFGWSLAEVLKKSKEIKKIEQSNEIEIISKLNKRDTMDKIDMIIEDVEEILNNEIDDSNELEIGTWSNDMAMESMLMKTDYETMSTNVTVLPPQFGWNNDVNDIRCGSPTFDSSDMYGYYSDDSYSDDGYIESSDESENEKNRGLKISYTGENTAEAVEDESKLFKMMINNKKIMNLFDDSEKKLINTKFLVKKIDNNSCDENRFLMHKKLHYDYSKKRETQIMIDGTFIKSDKKIIFNHCRKNLKQITLTDNNLELNNILIHNDYVKNIANEISIEISHDKLSSDLYHIKNQCNGNNIPIPSLYNDVDKNFSFDYQPELRGHPGPSPSLILQALTMSNANDGINLERLETIGDSFLKYAITTYLYCTYPVIHEGKLSHLRSKQVIG